MTGEVFPAGSVKLIPRLLDPSGRDTDGVTLQFPDPSTIPVPTIVPDPSRRVTIAQISPVPDRVGVVSFVRVIPPVEVCPLRVAIDGALGATVSIWIERESGVLIFPVGSVAVIVTGFDPSGSAEDGVNVQLPEASVVTVPIVVHEAFFISIVLFASAVPTIVGVVSAVRYGALISPPTLVTFGERGRRESIFIVRGVGVLVFPAISVIVTLSTFNPSGSTDDGVNDQLPDPLTLPVPSTVPEALITINIDPDSPVPEIVGVVSFVRELVTGATIVGAIGAVVSIVNVVDTGDPVFPAPSVRVTAYVVDPSMSGVLGVNE